MENEIEELANEISLETDGCKIDNKGHYVESAFYRQMAKNLIEKGYRKISPATLPEKKEVEPVCVCDCIPCKTDTCDRCELPIGHGGINALCNEECISDFVSGWNACHDAFMTALGKTENTPTKPIKNEEIDSCAIKCEHVENQGVTIADVIITHENTKWYRGECCSGYPNCIHKPLLASIPSTPKTLVCEHVCTCLEHGSMYNPTCQLHGKTCSPQTLVAFDEEVALEYLSTNTNSWRFIFNDRNKMAALRMVKDVIDYCNKFSTSPLVALDERLLVHELADVYTPHETESISDHCRRMAKVIYKRFGTSPLVKIEEKEVLTEILKIPFTQHSVMTYDQEIIKAICSKFGSPSLPSIHDIWVIIRSIKSGDNKPSDEEIAQAIRRFLEEKI